MKIFLGEHVASGILAEGRRLQELKLLRAAAAGTLPREITQDNAEYSYDVLAELCHADLMIATRQGRLVNPYFHSIRITHAGRDYLAALERQAEPDHAAQPADRKPPDREKTANEWDKHPLRKLAITVVGGVLVACLVYLMRHHLGIFLD